MGITSLFDEWSGLMGLDLQASGGRLTLHQVSKDAFKVAANGQTFYFEKTGSINKQEITESTVIPNSDFQDEMIPSGYEIHPDASVYDLLMKLSPIGTEKLRLLTSARPSGNTPKNTVVTISSSGSLQKSDVVQIGVVSEHNLIFDPVTVNEPLTQGEARLSFGVDKGGKKLAATCK